MCLNIIGGVLASDLQLDARHGDQVEQDHQRPRMEPLQRQQSWGESFYTISWVGMSLAQGAVMKCNYVVHLVILFPVILWLLSRAGAGVRDLKAWLVSSPRSSTDPSGSSITSAGQRCGTCFRDNLWWRKSPKECMHVVGLVSMWSKLPLILYYTHRENGSFLMSS